MLVERTHHVLLVVAAFFEVRDIEGLLLLLLNVLSRFWHFISIQLWVGGPNGIVEMIDIVLAIEEDLELVTCSTSA